jgi:oxidase EvaA
MERVLSPTKNDAALLFPASWISLDGLYKTTDILSWINELHKTVYVDIQKTTLALCGWFYDENCGQIVNQNRSFFQIAGFRQSGGQGRNISEQPVIIQDEIGYLGILCKEFGGMLHFLMQAKIEPGNVNKIQLSPTIQATKSNFTQKHGGAKPAYLDYFLNASAHTVIVDQIQSEQSSRFFGKRNRNIIILLDERIEVEEGPGHRWLTLGQIKRLMKIDNLVNMDTRTVLSCIPFYNFSDGLAHVMPYSRDPALIRSICEEPEAGVLPFIYRYINDYKMFSDIRWEIVPLYTLEDWEMKNGGGSEEFICKSGYPFKVVFCDISIEGREVKSWGQPLFEAVGGACFGLLTAVEGGIREFLVKARPEMGCFDKIELGPAVQTEAVGSHEDDDEVSRLFFHCLAHGRGVMHDVVLSEEGGRFYHEQNRNVVIEVDKGELPDVPAGYFWLSYRTLNQLVQINNCLNIQLRNLLSLLEI